MVKDGDLKRRDQLLCVDLRSILDQVQCTSRSIGDLKML